MAERVPLFPLGVVLFPGLVLPLHVFEERYRVLVGELLERPEVERRFGVVAIRSGREVGADGVRALYGVGCTAWVQGVQAYDDGRFDLVTSGVDRFRLLEVERDRPYLTGIVEMLPDEVGPADEAAVLSADVQAAYLDYLEALAAAGADAAETPDLPDRPKVLSYFVAATAVLDLHEQQALLAEPDAVHRLRTELAVLRREVRLLRSVPGAPAPQLARAPINPN